MTNPKTGTDDVRAFWNSRAALGLAAGSKDITLKRLEMDAIGEFVRDGMRVLDVGCGNGVTAVEVAMRHKVKVLGIDYAEEMVTAARGLAEEEGVTDSVGFRVGDVLDLSGIAGEFDLAYTERMLINLPDWPTQKQAIANIVSCLEKGGLYVMCESSQDGLDRINAMRACLGLDPIVRPWHNRYLQEDEVASAEIQGAVLEEVHDFSSTYYFLSRVVNAALGALEGDEPAYDAPINSLALKLPPFGGMGQTKIWRWRKL